MSQSRIKRPRKLRPSRLSIERIPLKIDRPGHVWRFDDETGRVVYMEDQIMEMEIGRKLTRREEVIHKNGDPLDNRKSNLEIVVVEGIE